MAILLYSWVVLHVIRGMKIQTCFVSYYPPAKGGQQYLLHSEVVCGLISVCKGYWDLQMKGIQNHENLKTNLSRYHSISNNTPFQIKSQCTNIIKYYISMIWCDRRKWDKLNPGLLCQLLCKTTESSFSDTPSQDDVISDNWIFAGSLSKSTND